jgi:hypothetical protein
MKSRLVDNEVRIVTGLAQISPRSPTPSKHVKEQIVNNLSSSSSSSSCNFEMTCFKWESWRPQIHLA